MTRDPLRVLWVTNMLYEPGAASPRGIFVTQSRDALRATGRVAIETEVVAQGRGALDYLGANTRVRARWDAGRFDLVHVHYGLTGLATLALPSLAPRMFTFYGSDLNDAVQRTVSVATARNAARRIFVSRRLADLWPDPANVVLPNGVDFAACAPRPREDACRELGLDPAKRYVLFGARPENPVKGHDVFVEVLRRLRDRRPDVEELVLTEPGASHERVVAKLNAAHVLLFTSRRGTEGSPTVVKEALAVGLPVVSTDVGDAKEMLAGVEPGGVVAWPNEDSAVARDAWLEALSLSAGAILDSGRRSDGREKRAALRQEAVTERLLAIYEEVHDLSRQPS
ncbi:MAG: glycosyltransferase family 4 protein [bacterium]